ncbi:hypothetical protein COT48_03850 [Candidatus Woesearchaeota archaeon CG08_land_8_20_14_0_20_47_9]|nr:MAG: hypothetical protein COT48_03850 [Candidatus Woesearchaeota archaeon CG08_land_8_20_14_0_20_47_9]
MEAQSYNATGVRNLNRSVDVKGAGANLNPGATRPEKRFRAGAISIAIWANQSEKGTWNSIQLTRCYKDKKTEQWKSTGSLRVADIPRAIVVLNKAYEYLVLSDNNNAIDEGVSQRY